MKTKLLILFLTLVMNVSGQSPDSLWQHSILNFGRKDYHGAIEDINELLKLIQPSSEVYYNRGVAWMYLGDEEKACADMETAKSVSSDKNVDYMSYACHPEILRNSLIENYYKKVAVYPETGYRPRYTRADTLRGALRPERTCFDVTCYDLKVKIIPRGKKIEGSNDIYFKVVLPTQRIQIDLFERYDITGITWSGKPLAWTREYNAVFISFPRELKPTEQHMITLNYKGTPQVAPNPPWEGGFVWAHDANKDLWISVACEQLGASSWWPTKDHLSDKPDSMLISLEIPKGYQAVSNGNLREVNTTKEKTDQYSWFVSYPINNYNVTFYIGKYAAFSDTLTDALGTVRFDYNVLIDKLEIAREHFKQTRDVVSFYNRAFGFYPFARDGFGLVESPYEGMEHQSAIAYGNNFGQNHDYDYRNKEYDFIIVHEGAHEWWGNSVTAADMADIWIHEGFATYAEYMFIESKFGRDEYMYELTDKSRYITNVWPMVQHRDVNENSFASNDVYHKGAMLLHCLRCTINNDSMFFDILRNFNIRNRYQTVTTQDFIDFVNRATGSDYTAFFSKYLYDTQIPVLSYTYKKSGNNLIFKYKWTGVGEGFAMPFGIATNNNANMRIVANTTWQEMILPDTQWFNFYNLLTGYRGCPDQAFTYFNTRCENNAIQSGQEDL